MSAEARRSSGKLAQKLAHRRARHMERSQQPLGPRELESEHAQPDEDERPARAGQGYERQAGQHDHVAATANATRKAR